MEQESEHIVDGAIMHKGKVYTGPRHYLIIKQIINKLEESPCSKGHGFLTSTDRFVSREEARKIAIASGQVKEDDLNPAYLISTEDLWEYPQKV